MVAWTPHLGNDHGILLYQWFGPRNGSRTSVPRKTTASTMFNVGQVFIQNATKIYQLSSGGKLILFVLYAFVLNNYFL